MNINLYCTDLIMKYNAAEEVAGTVHSTMTVMDHKPDNYFNMIIHILCVQIQSR